jgi:hypothetical protein
LLFLEEGTGKEMKVWSKLFIRDKSVKTVEASIVGRVFAEIVIAALQDWRLFSINEELQQCVQDEEKYLLAFTIGHVMEEVLKDCPECRVVKAYYQSYLEKRIDELGMNKDFIKNLSTSREIAYKEALKNPNNQHWFVDLGRRFSGFCGDIEKPEFIAEGILYFTVCSNSFRKSLKAMNVVI